MSTIDIAILIAYLLAMVAVGVYCSRKSAASMKAYFLGNNESKWWMLAASGAASNYDVTGTMFLVSLFYVVGLRAFWMLWSWQFFGAAFLMCYMALWVRRTKVMTAVELMYARFGDDAGGRMARTAGAVLMVTFLTVSVGYAFVVTDFIQTVLMSISGLLVGVIVYCKLDADAVAKVHELFDLNMLPQARLDMPEGYESWNNFGILCVYWAVAGFLLNTSGAGGHYQEQRFLATKNTAEAAKAGWGWGFFPIPRWAMIAGFTFIAAAGTSR